MTTLYAQPYDISATGFYFDSAEDYAQKVAKNFNPYGGLVEEYELQFIDGESIDAGRLSAGPQRWYLRSISLRQSAMPILDYRFFDPSS